MKIIAQGAIGTLITGVIPSRLFGCCFGLTTDRRAGSAEEHKEQERSFFCSKTVLLCGIPTWNGLAGSRSYSVSPICVLHSMFCAQCHEIQP